MTVTSDITIEVKIEQNVTFNLDVCNSKLRDELAYFCQTPNSGFRLSEVMPRTHSATISIIIGIIPLNLNGQASFM